MRWLVLVVVLAGGCRFGFDPGVAPDAVEPPCAGHDEDGDVFPDDCDVCPTVADTAQRDGDGDGVGDACDPRPATPGDYIQMFEPHTDRAASLYTREFNVVEWQADALRLGALDAAGSVVFVLDAYPSRLSVHARIVDASALQHWFGLWYNQTTTLDPKIFASAAYTPPGPVVFSLKEQVDAGTERFCPDRDEGPPIFAAGQSYTFVVDTEAVTGDGHRVEIRSPSESWSCSISKALPSYNRGFIEAYRVIVEYDYFIAYGVR